MTALYGGLQNIQGRITMSAELMNNLIRQKGHTLEIKENTDTVCRIKGTRKDTKEHYEATFSMEDAKRALLVKEGGGWTKYPSAMLFARCISRLAKRLFPDVIGGAYVEGELDDATDDKKTKTIESKVIPMSEPIAIEAKAEPVSTSPFVQSLVEMEQEQQAKTISEQDCEKIEMLISPDDKEGPESYRTNLLKFFMVKYKLPACNSFADVPEKALKSIFSSVHKRNEFLMKQQEERVNG